MSGERRIRFIGSVTAYACCSASRISTLPVSLMLETFGYCVDARLTIADTICHMSPRDLTDLELETAARACRVVAHRERKVLSNQRSCFARAW